MPKEDEDFVRMDNKALLEHAFGEVTVFLEKRSRRKKEEECYLIANKSQFGWKTTKTYFDETFKNDSDDDDKDFWEMPDLKPDEKLFLQINIRPHLEISPQNINNIRKKGKIIQL